MKKPFRGERWALACLWMVGIAAALCVARQTLADDGLQPGLFGPDITPLGRPTVGPANTLNYSDPAQKPADGVVNKAGTAPAAFAQSATMAQPTIGGQTSGGQNTGGQVPANSSPAPVLKFPFSQPTEAAKPTTTVAPQTSGTAGVLVPVGVPGPVVAPSAVTTPSNGNSLNIISPSGGARPSAATTQSTNSQSLNTPSNVATSNISLSIIAPSNIAPSNAESLPSTSPAPTVSALPRATAMPTVVPIYQQFPSAAAMPVSIPATGTNTTPAGTTNTPSSTPSSFSTNTAALVPLALPTGNTANVAKPIDVPSAPAQANPLQSAPTGNSPTSDASGTQTKTPAANAPTVQPAKINPWRPIQAAFREFSNSKSDSSGPAPAAEVIDQKVSQEAKPLAAPNTPVIITPRIAYVRADGMTTAPAEIPPTGSATYSTGSMATNGGVPPDVVYEGPSGGCNCGGGSPDGSGSCRTCGGWQPGTCKTQDPNGSCVLQRLACCLSKPYPDCSNGCVDFCHSWIFHEDDCWLFSNHKCCPGGCGPWPYGTCSGDGQGQCNSGTCSGGCNCGCGPCVPPPDVYFTVGALVLHPTTNAHDQPVVLNTTLGTTAFSTNDLGQDWRVGPDLTLGYRPTKMDAWELTYFGMYDWNDNVFVQGASNLSLPGVLGGLPNFSTATTVQVDYNSQIDNVELNYFWHHDNPNFMWMAGFRYFQLDEKLNISATGTGTDPGEYDVRTSNNMGGAQIGFRCKHCCDWFEWDLTGKAGAFGNSVGQAQIAFDPDAPNPALRAGAGRHEGDWAFVGQLGSNVSVRLCPSWSLMAGYGVMWVDGVALAPDQLDFSGTGAGLDKNGRVLYQGGNVSVACRW